MMIYCFYILKHIKKEVIELFLCKNFIYLNKLLARSAYFSVIKFNHTELPSYYLVVENESEFQLLNLGLSIAQDSIYDSIKLYKIINSLKVVDEDAEVFIDKNYQQQLLYHKNEHLIDWEKELIHFNKSNQLFIEPCIEKKRLRKIYLMHSSELNFEEQLYKPIRVSFLSEKYHIIFSNQEDVSTRKTLIWSCDLVVAEVSLNSTQLGIELAWAEIVKLPIIGVHRVGFRILEVYKSMITKFINYSSYKELIDGLDETIESHFQKI